MAPDRAALDALLDPFARWIAPVGGVVGAEAFEPRIPGTATLAGRIAASRALAELGLPGLTRDDRFSDGRPRWPAGASGSITHSAGWAVCVIVPRPVGEAPATGDARGGRGTMGRTVGVDLEVDGALSAAEAEFVLTGRERVHVARSRTPDTTATLLWSAKEAAFKAWSELLAGDLPTVHPERDLDVWLEASTGAVRVEARGLLAEAFAARPDATPLALEGMHWRSGGLVLAAVVAGRAV